MILGLIFSILSVTYTVESSSSVHVTGEAPISSNAVYTRSGTTGQKGQMTAGNSTTLELVGWDGCVIDSVVLSMRSNKEQGAGSLVMSVGERLVWKISDSDFAHDNWHGSYTTNWVDITQHIGKRVAPQEVVKIHIKASKNSLYIQHYTIYYSLPDPKAYEVRLLSGLYETPAPMIEETIGAGIVLPAWGDTLEWRFLGWSEKEVLEDTISPPVMQAGTRYYPKGDCWLWAVYSDSEGNIHSTDAVSGEYVLASNFWQIALKGGVENEEIATAPISIEENTHGEYTLMTGAEKKMTYYIDFMEDNTASILHIGSKTMIGYDGTHLASGDDVWQYRLLDDGSYCFYYNDKGQTRMLCLGYGKDGSNNQIVAYLNRANVETMNGKGFLLFPVGEMESPQFTSWPFGKLNGVENVPATHVGKTNGEYMLYMGNAVLHIKNGQKTLRYNKN